MPPGRREPQRRRRASLTGSLAVACLVLASCISSASSGQDFRSKIERRPPNKEFLNGAVAANNAFAADLYRSVMGTPGNFVYSPYALFTGLSMLRAGSDPTSDTRRQLDALLHADIATDLDTGINTLDQALASRAGKKESEKRFGDVELTIAELLWFQRGTHFKQDYLDQLASSYGAGVRSIDFRSDAETARRAINEWGANATGGRIEELAARGDVTSFTSVLVATTGFIQAPWRIPFDPDKTKPAPFHRLGDVPSTVRLMQLTAPAGVRHASSPDWTAVELPYLGDELQLDIIQPVDGQFEAFEQSMHGDRLAEIVKALEPQPVDLRVPQFQFETATNLTDALHTPMPQAFANEAAFSGISSDEMLSISEVLWKGFFGINEEGTNPATIASADAIPGTTVAGTISVTIDRPFVFLVRDRETGAILEIGRVTNP